MNICSAVSCTKGEFHFSLNQVPFHPTLMHATHTAQLVHPEANFIDERWLMRSYTSEAPKGSLKEEGNGEIS